MLNVVLYEPEIPPNTGNIIRLCANTGARLHLVEPLGFALDDRELRRAGLDYHEFASVQVHATLDHCRAALGGAETFAFSTRGLVSHTSVAYPARVALLFGPESRGLPESVLAGLDEGHCVRLPMRPGVRSLNLSNAVAVAVYEAWRQRGFQGADVTDADTVRLK